MANERKAGKIQREEVRQRADNEYNMNRRR